MVPVWKISPSPQIVTVTDKSQMSYREIVPVSPFRYPNARFFFLAGVRHNAIAGLNGETVFHDITPWTYFSGRLDLVFCVRKHIM